MTTVLLPKGLKAKQAECSRLAEERDALSKEMRKLDNHLHATGPTAKRSLTVEEVEARQPLHTKREELRVAYLAARDAYDAYHDALLQDEQYGAYLDRELGEMRAEGYVF